MLLNTTKLRINMNKKVQNMFLFKKLHHEQIINLIRLSSIGIYIPCLVVGQHNHPSHFSSVRKKDYHLI